MAQFTDLPNEIVAMIAETVLPGDIVNFSATSKKIQSVSEKSLQKHHEMKLEHKRRDCTKNGTPLSNLLHDVVSQPTIALYVEHLTLGTWSDRWNDGHEASHTMYPQEKMVTLEEAVAASVPSDQVLTWVTALRSGDEDPALAFWSHFPTSLSDFYTHTRDTRNSGLTTLEVNMKGSEFDDWNPTWQAINILAKLPSLRSITVENMDIVNDEERSESLLPSRSSNVTSLIFSTIYIRAQQLQRFLEGFKGLERLSYDVFNSPRDALETLRIRAALLTHAKASLEYLYWFEYASPNCHMGSLRDFENLKEVHTRLESLMNAEHPSGRFLAQMLPASVEKVHLHPSYVYSQETISDLIIQAADDKQKHLPNLKELHVARSMYAHYIDLMEAKCKDAGFDLFIG